MPGLPKNEIGLWGPLQNYKYICQFAIISEVRVETTVGFVRGNHHRFGSRLTRQERGRDPAAGRFMGFSFPSDSSDCSFELVGCLLAGWLGGWLAHFGWSGGWWAERNLYIHFVCSFPRAQEVGGLIVCLSALLNCHLGRAQFLSRFFWFHSCTSGRLVGRGAQICFVDAFASSITASLRG